MLRVCSGEEGEVGGGGLCYVLWLILRKMWVILGRSAPETHFSNSFVQNKTNEQVIVLKYANQTFPIFS